MNVSNHLEYLNLFMQLWNNIAINLQGPYCMCVNRYSSLGVIQPFIELVYYDICIHNNSEWILYVLHRFFYCFTKVCLCSTLQSRFSSLQLLVFSTVKNCHWDVDEIKKATKQLSAILREHFFKKKSGKDVGISVWGLKENTLISLP